jgi:two-component sensor histidine kinase
MRRKNERFIERLPLAVEQPLLSYGIATVVVALAFLIRGAADPLLPQGLPYITFFPAVTCVAFFFGARPGICAAVLSAAIAWYFWLPPYGSFALTAPTAVALLFFALVATTEIGLVHLLQRANTKLAMERERSRDLAHNRELLFRELQHRVSNNLQVVAALIALQRRDVADNDARKVLDEASRRLALIGKISRALYDPRGQRMRLPAFIKALAADILEASGRIEIVTRIDVEDDIAIAADHAVPLALIFAEAVSNAIEHGFAERDSGSLTVSMRKTGPAKMRLEVVDDGRGLPDNFDVRNSDSLGLRIALTLAQQLHGTFRLMPGTHGGTCAVLDMPC